ncbi:MAG: SpoIIE family protein phosphatase [Treponema sp.]|jgi:sigma-B regulation protein RsbU (phosphoserine phosphatase)|nr:SpoIIE family protein phosphatase [Treponema sp.]
MDDRSEGCGGESPTDTPAGGESGGAMKIKTRILIQTLGASLALTLVLGAVFFLAVAGIRSTAKANSGELGDSAAGIGAHAMEIELTEKINRIAQDTALLLDERLGRIENHTRMTADITGSIYSTRQSWSPKPLPLVRPGEVPPPEPYLFLATGANYSRIRAEVELAANISDMLRQITVVDRGIATSTIGGEAGYIIGMDAFPWPSAEFDPRSFGWYRGAVAAGDLYWTDLYDDHRGRGPAISCAVPFFEQSGGGRTLRGVARSTVLLSTFSQMIDSAGVGRGGQLFILNRDGVKIYSSQGADVEVNEEGVVMGENFLESPNARLRSLGMSMTLGATGMTELTIDKLPVYVAYAPIKTLGWSLGASVSVQEISASAFLIENQIWRIADSTIASIDRYILLLVALIALLLLVVLVGASVFAVRFTGAITGPILALNDGVHEVAGGNLEREVVVKTGDELEQLAVSFNMMTSQLRTHIEEIARATAERQRINTELDIATRIQMSMLPNEFPPFRGRKNEFDLYAQVHPAKEVGGDFYDFFFIDDDHFVVLAADVSGKGVPAALFMAISKTVIKNRLQGGEDPALALEIINHQLCDNNIMDMFVTVWLCVLEISSGRLVYVNAGHNPPLLKRGDRDFDFLVSQPDLVLAGMDDTRYHSREMHIKAGDILFLYTDGVTEAGDPVGGFYGKERLKAFLDANAGGPLDDLVHGLFADITAFGNGAEQFDDITMLALRIGRDTPPRSITLKAELAQLEALNAFIGGELDAAACPQQVRGQIELAAEEVFVNIVDYAYQGGEGELTVEFSVRQSPEGTTMTLAFIDQGRPFNPLDHADPDLSLPLEERQPGGLGILIVKKTMDKMHYSFENGTNRLALCKSWQKEGQ